MQSADILNQLNDSQRSAVEYIDGPSLVIAGAGSGKTRVLTYKIAYLLLNGVKPWQIMALTFTNKAAREMKERISNLVGDKEAQYLKMGTFHSIFASLLRYEAKAIGYADNFTIYDEADSRSLCKAIIKDLGLDEKIYKPAEVHRRISEAKNRLMLPADYADHAAIRARDKDNAMPEMATLYNIYSQRQKLSNAMDFDDLLLNTYCLFLQHPDLCEKYAQRYSYFLVDEYQDTNYAQQQIIQQLTSVHHNICVVGDDAQSIYGFRGANIDNILNFQRIYPEARLFKLERNYRSTKNIVAAANSLIHKNERQIRKEVFSENASGDKVRVAELSSDREEALFISKDIRRIMRSKEGAAYSDFAILYRTNSQSRTFEEEFMKQNLPYRIYGGMSFYQRKEIKDIIAYLRLVANPDDEEAFKRIINYPARGIGGTTIQKITDTAREMGISLWQVIARATEGGIGDQALLASLNINKGTLSKLLAFRTMIEGFMARLITDDAATLGKDIIRDTGISKDIYSCSDPDYISKQEHLEEFASSLQAFVEDRREEGEPDHLLDFLHEVALLTDRDSDDASDERITLMTIHSAKGLEFPYVYVAGMEENLFPSPMCTQSVRLLEEERRLLYVAITRAEKLCTLTYANSRYRFGKMEYDPPSRFLRDIDPALLTYGDNTTSASVSRPRNPYPNRSSFGLPFSSPRPATGSFGSPRPATGSPFGKPSPYTATPSSRPAAVGGSAASAPGWDFTVGQAVMHHRFGRGVIRELTDKGDSAKAIVDFDNAGTKQLLLKFAKLQQIQ